MTWLVIGLFSEGSSDSRFLPNIIYRQTLNLLLSGQGSDINLQEELQIFRERNNDNRIARICRESGAVNLFIVHSDAARNARSRLLRTIVGGIRLGTSERCGLEAYRVVPLMPCREMESWTLADPDAIARACGFEMWPNHVQRSWDAALAETIDDPKRVLDEALEALHSRTRRRRIPPASYFLERIGSEVDLQRLMRLDSFQEFSKSLEAALRRGSYL